MQHDEAASAPKRPPAAISVVPRPEPSAIGYCLIVMPRRLHPVGTTGSRSFFMGASTAAQANRLTIGGLSQLTGVNIETIRYYEKIKVLPVPSRAANGRRMYGPMEHRILAFVRRSRELGFSLDEVRALLRLGGPEKASCREVREIAAQHLDDIRAA